MTGITGISGSHILAPAFQGMQEKTSKQLGARPTLCTISDACAVWVSEPWASGLLQCTIEQQDKSHRALTVDVTHQWEVVCLLRVQHGLHGQRAFCGVVDGQVIL